MGQDVDRRSDVFALGIVLYELYTVRRLFKASSEFLTMTAIVSGAVPRPSLHRAEIPPAQDAPPMHDGPVIDATPDAPPPPPMFVTEAHAFVGAVAAITYTLTIPQGTNRFLLVAVELPSECDTPVPDIVSITYNGSALSRFAMIVGTPCGGTTTRSEQWGLVAPTVGTHDVAVTLSDIAPYTIHSGALEFINVDQTSPVRASAVTTGSSNSSSLDVASAPGDLVVNTVAQGTSITASGQTMRYIQNVDGSINMNNSAASTASATGMTTTMTWTFGDVDEWQTISSSLQP